MIIISKIILTVSASLLQLRVHFKMLAKRMEQSSSPPDNTKQHLTDRENIQTQELSLLQQQKQKNSASLLTKSLRNVSRISSPPQSSHLQHFAILSVMLILAHQSSLAQSRSISSSSSSSSSSPSSSSPVHYEDRISSNSIRRDGDDLGQSSLSPHHRSKRSVSDDPVLWENNVIPFIFEEPFPRRYKNQVIKAMNVWSKKTCVKFEDRNNQEYFLRIEIKDGSGCDSRIGLVKWPVYRNVGQPLRLTYDCLRKRGYIIHELGHTLGLHHEHQRPDTYQYLTISYTNVNPLYYYDLEPLNFTTITPYDFASVMHYPLNQYGVNTMEIRPNATHLAAGIVIGQRHTVSKLDAVKVNFLYKCNEEAEEIEVPSLNGDNVYTGEQLGLLATGSEFSDQSWLSCNDAGCKLNTCPGKYLRDNDKEKCPFNIFTLHKLLTNESLVVKVGDAVVLEHKSSSENPLFNTSRFVSCDFDTQECSLSSECTAARYRFNETFCQHNILIVRAEGKGDGETVTHKDVIGFEFRTEEGPDNSLSHNPHLSIQNSPIRCAFGCNPATNKCSKELCLPVQSGNSLSLGLNPVTTPTKCGKDMFLIKKI